MSPHLEVVNTISQVTLRAKRESLRRRGGGRGTFIGPAARSRLHGGRVLDVGCAFGWALADLRDYADELWGVDIDDRALERAARDYPFLNLVRATGAELPFDARSFDVVILTEVIEHVSDASKEPLVREVHRVLRPGGTLVLTAPHAGALAWTDPMDVKRRLRRLYRLYMRLSGYRPDTPVEVGHKHVSLVELRHLLDGRFEIEELRLCGMLTPLLTWPLAVNARVRFLPSALERALADFRAWESGIECPRLLAENVWVVARRCPD